MMSITALVVSFTTYYKFILYLILNNWEMDFLHFVILFCLSLHKPSREWYSVKFLRNELNNMTRGIFQQDRQEEIPARLRPHAYQCRSGKGFCDVWPFACGMDLTPVSRRVSTPRQAAIFKIIYSLAALLDEMWMILERCKEPISISQCTA